MRTCDNCGREFGDGKIQTCTYCGYINGPAWVCSKADTRHSPPEKNDEKGILLL